MSTPELKGTATRSLLQGVDLVLLRSDLAVARFRNLILMCHPKQDPSDASWDAWLAWSAVQRYRGVLVSSHGGGPSARQRSALNAMRRKAEMDTEMVALLSDSSVLRGMLTAIGWVTSNPVKAFAPHEVEVALKWLGLEGCTGAVTATLATLHAEITGAR